MQSAPYLAPDFNLPDSSGQYHALKDYAGKWLVLYFYPKDDTPGCTTEACSFRDIRDELIALGAEVVGVSKDGPELHEKFKEKLTLNFTLLCDEEAEATKAYGAWGKKMFGRQGILRRTFIIDPQGQVAKVFGRVTPLGHGEQVIKTLKELQNQTQ